MTAQILTLRPPPSFYKLASLTREYAAACEQYEAAKQLTMMRDINNREFHLSLDRKLAAEELLFRAKQRRAIR